MYFLHNKERKRTNFRGHNNLWVKFLRGLIFVDKSQPTVVTVVSCLCVQIFVSLIFMGMLGHKNYSPTKIFASTVVPIEYHCDFGITISN